MVRSLIQNFYCSSIITYWNNLILGRGKERLKNTLGQFSVGDTSDSLSEDFQCRRHDSNFNRLWATPARYLDFCLLTFSLPRCRMCWFFFWECCHYSDVLFLDVLSHFGTCECICVFWFGRNFASIMMLVCDVFVNIF